MYMEFTATAKYIRTSTRKLRLIRDAIFPLSPEMALVQLSQLTKQAAGPMAKVIASAAANAKQKQVSLDKLTFRQIEVMGAGGMKRFHAVSRGSAHAYKKRMTHVRVVLTDDDTTSKKSS